MGMLPLEYRDCCNYVHRFRNVISNARQDALLWRDATLAASNEVGSWALERIRANLDNATAMLAALRGILAKARQLRAMSHEIQIDYLERIAGYAARDVEEVQALYDRTREIYVAGE